MLVNDLARSRFGFVGVWLASRFLTRSPVVRFDGPASVRSAFTRAEALALAERAGLTGATAQRSFPARFLLSLGAEMTWDALVIGAGPAGSVTARELARRGCRVLLVDKATFPRTKVCGCCLNGAAIRTLERLGLGHVLAGAVPLNRFTRGGRFAAGGVRLAARAGAVREVLDARLVDEAVKAGVEFRPGTVVNRDSERLSRAKIAIVASGLTGGESPADRVRGSAPGRPGGGCAPDFYGPHTIYMAIGRGGYVGLVRVEDDRLDVAAAFDPAFVKSSGGLGPAAESILREVGWPAPPGLRTRLEGDASADSSAARALRGMACSSSATRPGTSSRSPARGWPGR